jgi:hypothetical protein
VETAAAKAPFLKETLPCAIRLSADDPCAFFESPAAPSPRGGRVEHDMPPTKRLRRIRKRSDLDLIQNPWIAI